MNNVQIREHMYKFLNTFEFKERDVKLVDDEYKDPKTGLVLAQIIRKLSDIRKYDHPVLYVSNYKAVLKETGEAFRASKWDCERINSMSDEEFDYAYLIQCRKLGVTPLEGTKYQIKSKTEKVAAEG